MKVFQVSGSEKEVDDPANSNQVTGTAGNIDISKITNDNAGVVSNTPDEVTPQGKNPVVVLDGPLGRAYTEALNLAYAKEDTGTIALIAGAYDQQKKQQEDNANSGELKGTYVYAVGGDTLNQRECVDTTNWLTRVAAAGHQDIVVSLETHRSVSPKSAQIEEFAKSVGAKVVYSRSALMKHLASRPK